MKSKIIVRVAIIALWTLLPSCVPSLGKRAARPVDRTVPKAFTTGSKAKSKTSAAKRQWRKMFNDPNMLELIDLALEGNQELGILTQEIAIANAETIGATGEYLPTVSAGVGSGIEKVGETTSQGRADEANGVPRHLQDHFVGLFAHWEVDIWNRLRSAKKAAVMRLLATEEGRRFAVTRLVAEIAGTYYELESLDNQLRVLDSNLVIQKKAFEAVKLQKQAARVTELAVLRFQALIFDTESRLFEVKQQIVESENRLNFLVGRFPQPIKRSSDAFVNLEAQDLPIGNPKALLENRPDVRQAEYELSAAKLDVVSARASFYPSLGISARIGYQSFRISDLIRTPASIFYNAGADLLGPIFNRRGLIAGFEAGNARQMQAVLNYERMLLTAVHEVTNQAARIQNFGKSVELKKQQVATLTTSIEVSSRLFQSARADYLEVLTARQEVIESELELIERKKEELLAVVNLYQTLGGGW